MSASSGRRKMNVGQEPLLAEPLKSSLSELFEAGHHFRASRDGLSPACKRTAWTLGIFREWQPLIHEYGLA